MADYNGVLFTMGNPLLDISANVEASLLEKYEIPHGSAIMAAEKQLPVYSELAEKYEVEYIPGGSTQNTARVFSWMLQKPNSAVYVGCVGNDAFAEKMRERAVADGLIVPYLVNESTPTGTCAVLIVGKERALCANLSAAEKFDAAYLTTPEISALIQKAKFYYMEGFFQTHGHQSVQHVATHAAENNKVFATNISAPFLVQFFLDSVMKTMPYVDILFGNDEEALAFAKALNLETTDLTEIAKHISALPKVNKNRPRTVVITCGKNPVIVVSGDEVNTFDVPAVPADSIVDTNGAGDSFVAGYLSQLVQEKPVAECVRAGNYAAGVVIQHSGCTYPAQPNFS